MYLARWTLGLTSMEKRNLKTPSPIWMLLYMKTALKIIDQSDRYITPDLIRNVTLSNPITRKYKVEDQRDQVASSMFCHHRPIPPELTKLFFSPPKGPPV